MKRICVSAGLVALGAVAANGQYAPGLSSVETTKPWALSATIRGFYDDNYLTLPKTIPGPNGTTIPGARDSYGTEVSPSASYNHSTSDTLISATYTYDMTWYEDRLGRVDQSHQLNAKLDHEFSERYKIQVNESFVVAQEPSVLYPGVISSPLRVAGNNVRNSATADFTAQLSRLFDVHVGYGNTFYAFQENAGDEFPANSYPSYSALLDRMEQTVPVDLHWKILPETTGVFGFQYDHTGYTSPEYIIYPGISPFTGVPVPGYLSSSRDNDSYLVYVGVDQSLSPNLSFSLRLGGQYLDYYNFGSTTLSPYANASLTYQYMPASTLQVGVVNTHNATDVAGIIGTTPVLDEESTSSYVAVNHRLNSRLAVSFMGQAQFSTYNGGGGTFNGLEEDFYILTLNFDYHFNPWLTGQTGYNYNRLVSPLQNRSYSRDIFYLGLRASY